MASSTMNAAQTETSHAGRARVNAQERQTTAEGVMKGIYYAMGGNREREQALTNIYTGLILSPSAANQEVFGLLVALRARVANPDALGRAVLQLYGGLLPCDQLIAEALDGLAVPMNE